MNKPILNILDYYRNKAFAYLGLVQTDINPNTTDEEDLYINNIDDIVHNKIREYNIWYSGDSDKIMNFYTRNILYNYNTEPLYDRNKRSYFWSVSSTEEDIKRTHSGQPRNMVDTLVDIVNVPECTCSDKDDTAKLKKILSDNNFDELYLQEHLPYELIEGWGAWKIDWDKSLRNTPILIRYRAEEVDFIYKERQLIAIIYKNYYKSKDDKSYVLFEVRRQERVKDAVDGKWHSNLIIEKELYELGRDGALVKRELKNLDQLSDIEPKIVISDYEGFLGAPCIIIRVTTARYMAGPFIQVKLTYSTIWTNVYLKLPIQLDAPRLMYILIITIWSVTQKQVCQLCQVRTTANTSCSLGHYQLTAARVKLSQSQLFNLGSILNNTVHKLLIS